LGFLGVDGSRILKRIVTGYRLHSSGEEYQIIGSEHGIELSNYTKGWQILTS
jgi:hypothetical protein